MEKGLIIASFGTTHKDTRVRTISNIETSITNSLGRHSIYSIRAFTSRIVKKRIYENEGLYIYDEMEAKKFLLDRGINSDDIFIQPLHLLPGHEYEKIKKMDGVKLGEPLFSSKKDLHDFVEKVSFDVNDDQVLILFGHGTDHKNDVIYKDLEYVFHEKGKRNIFIVCVEGGYDLEHCINNILQLNPQKVFLQPLMIVAGDHAKNDMASNEEGSLRSSLQKYGLNIESRLIGLGEIKSVVELFENKANKLVTGEIESNVSNDISYL